MDSFLDLAINGCPLLRFDIPVVWIANREVARHRLDEDDLIQRLKEATGFNCDKKYS